MRHLDEPPGTAPDHGLESVVVRVLDTVAGFEDVPTTELPPLFEAVDPDALEAIFSSPPDGPRRASGSVTFPYAGYRLTVSADGSVEAERADRSDGN